MPVTGRGKLAIAAEAAPTFPDPLSYPTFHILDKIKPRQPGEELPGSVSGPGYQGK
jgi:hypothetical protein